MHVLEQLKVDMSSLISENGSVKKECALVIDEYKREREKGKEMEKELQHLGAAAKGKLVYVL
jgi:hypothetical protein